MMDKLRGLLLSRRFHAAVFGVLVVVLQEVLGLTEETANAIAAVVCAWIIGDSITKTDTPATPPPPPE